MYLSWFRRHWNYPATVNKWVYISKDKKIYHTHFEKKWGFCQFLKNDDEMTHTQSSFIMLVIVNFVPQQFPTETNINCRRLHLPREWETDIWTKCYVIVYVFPQSLMHKGNWEWWNYPFTCGWRFQRWFVFEKMFLAWTAVEYKNDLNPSYIVDTTNYRRSPFLLTNG